MKTLKEIVCANLIALRKENGLTQVDLSKKINYSDKAISRWEKGEVTPSLEILESLSEIYKVSPSYFFEEHMDDETKKGREREKNLYVAILLSLTLVVWIIALFTFFMIQSFSGEAHIEVFMWAIPASAFVIRMFCKYMLQNRFYLVTSTISFWTLAIAVYIEWLELNLWVVFILGVPVQITIILMDYVRRIRIKNPKKKIRLKNKN